ncbi:hypothetical protein OAA08_00780 [bacterium]|jgi:hypothetical protein|nr:hypothetical protein [bacterium]
MTITLRSTKGSELSFAELDGNFQDLDLRASQNANNISNMDSDLAYYIGIVNALDSGFDSDVLALNVRVGPLETQQALNTNNIANLLTDVSTNTGNISTLQSSVGTNTSNISTNTGNIGTLTTTTGTHTSQIGALLVNVANNDSDIALLYNMRNDNNERLDSAESRLDSVDVNYISLSTLQSVTAASIDFADFQSRIAAL